MRIFWLRHQISWKLFRYLSRYLTYWSREVGRFSRWLKRWTSNRGWKIRTRALAEVVLTACWSWNFALGLFHLVSCRGFLESFATRWSCCYRTISISRNRSSFFVFILPICVKFCKRQASLVFVVWLRLRIFIECISRSKVLLRGSSCSFLWLIISIRTVRLIRWMIVLIGSVDRHRSQIHSSIIHLNLNFLIIITTFELARKCLISYFDKNLSAKWTKNI